MAKDWLETPYSLVGKRVWVAGHHGMVGSALLRRLARAHCEILTVDRAALDLRNQGDVGRWVSRHRPDVVVIAAAKVGGIAANAQNPAAFFYDNIMIATNIIHAAYQTGVARLLFLGSSCIYPRDCAQPIQESALLSGALEPTNEAYALAKIGALKMAGYYRAQYGCDFISAMPCNVYGMGDRYDLQNSHVIPALIMKAHRAKISKAQSLSVWGSGKALREFLSVDDLADGLVFLLQNYNALEHINIGSGQEITISNLARMICDVIGYKGKLIFDTDKPDGTPRKIMDSARLFSKGWAPTVSLQDGLAHSYDDFLRNVA